VRFGQHAGTVAAARAAVGECEQVLDLGQGEAEFLGAFDEPQHRHRRGRVVAVSGRRPRWRGEQAASFVVAQRLSVYPGSIGHLARSHHPRMNPVPRYRVNRSLDRPAAAVPMRHPCVTGTERMTHAGKYSNGHAAHRALSLLFTARHALNASQRECGAEPLAKRRAAVLLLLYGVVSVYRMELSTTGGLVFTGVGVAGFEPTASSSRKPRARSQAFRIVALGLILRATRVSD
jgi:hypothetical protein